MLTRRHTIAALIGCSINPSFAKNGRADTPLRGTQIAYPQQVVDIRSAWLHGETDRYRHFVLGGRFEATSVSVIDRNDRPFHLELPGDAVFEDRIIRMVDLDADGRTELAIVISREGVGSSLALLGLRDGALRILAETAPNGRNYRWLNPSGVGRFLGGDSHQIAIVRRPHLDATLELYAFDGSILERKASVEGYPTHRNGSRHQRLFAVLSGKGSAADRLVVPAGARDAIAVLDFTRVGYPEMARLALPGKADGEFRYHAASKRLAVPLESGAIAQISLAAFAP
jgi:hypothetical protein